MSKRRSKQPPPSQSRRSASTVVCFGEVLWDCLPKGLFLGGAPINAAYHLAQQGLNVLPVTAVGKDFLGDEILRRVTAWGVDVAFIARDRDWPTGTVVATLDRAGAATYDIVRNVAWDRIPATPGLVGLDPAPAAIVFGTLALRSAANRRELQRLLEAWPAALRVVDLNFRPPFNTAQVTTFALKHAQLLKLNDVELGQLTGETGRTTHALERSVRALAEQTGIAKICVTAGARGAGIWWEGEWSWEDGRRLRDTVGAGDAFLGGLLGSVLNGTVSPKSALTKACRLGEFVASQDGATPEYRLSDSGRPIGD
jgi:fructokinase